MNWREWIFIKLSGDVTLQGLVNDRIFGTIDATPERPFVVIRFSPAIQQVKVGEFQDVVIWVHDQPQSYTRIDEILAAIRAVLEGPVTEQDAIHVDWQGHSGDLADDARGTILRNSSYRLVGRRAAA